MPDKQQKNPIDVGVFMGSISDRELMEGARERLKFFNVPYAGTVASGHRTEAKVKKVAAEWEERGCKVFLVGAGLAAHLAGVLASVTTLPIIAVPLCSTKSTLGGLDSLLSTVQMPPGIPVLTVAINCSANAAIGAVQILALQDKTLAEKLVSNRMTMAANVDKAAKELAEVHDWAK